MAPLSFSLTTILLISHSFKMNNPLIKFLHVLLIRSLYWPKKKKKSQTPFTAWLTGEKKHVFISSPIYSFKSHLLGREHSILFQGSQEADG